ncbi:hypothetical protein CSC12_2718 [Klebsiella michiganensis]|nr:hypothetical protein CSC12_2718 [Klebsiella michiganensis]
MLTAISHHFPSLSGGYLRERISSLLRNELSMLCFKAFF